jgi:seryl-tRNA synthetase
MLNLELIRNDTETVRQSLARRGADTDLEPLLALDEHRRALITERDNLRGQHNELSRRFGELRQKEGTERGAAARLNRLRQELQGISGRIETLEKESSKSDEQLQELLLGLPNLPLPHVPNGLDESNNQVVSQWGNIPSLGFTPLPHWDLGVNLGIIDFKRGVKLAGSGFFVLTGFGARLERALINWMLDLHTQEHGYTEVLTPSLVREAVMLGSGNLPKFGENLYRDNEEDLWLIPTAEVPLTGLHREEILEPGILPLRYVSYSPSFRRERAAAGRETRGIKRVHQFDKVELYRLVEPANSREALAELITEAEAVCRGLELPYRVLELCAGDLGFQSAQTYDIEVWAAGCQEWLEVSSCSNCTDFQSRRSGIRYRTSHGKRPTYPHTINGSGLALPRVLIALLENNQQSDGSIVLPDTLVRYTGFKTITPPAQA